MSTHCTRCDSTGYLNIEHVPDYIMQHAEHGGYHSVIRLWIANDGQETDVVICDCCGNGEDWHGTPGEHYNDEDPRGPDGPYAYNEGLCECN